MHDIRKYQEKVFRELYQTHKGKPMAVSSESLAHKKQRYDIISRMFENDRNVTLHDVGMGIGDFKAYLKDHHYEKNITYSGTEILEEFVNEARKRFPDGTFYHRDIAEKSFDDTHDYIIMSGVFHQRREIRIKDWEKFSQTILKNAFQMCKKGMVFNFISPFVDFYQTQVYYCNLPKLLNFINDDLSRFFQLHHDYALYEFTVFVYKEEYIKKLHPQSEFQKYFNTKEL